MKKDNHKKQVKELYSNWAEVYDKSVEQGLPYLVEQDVLIKKVAPEKGEKILDVGCGTGRVTEQIYKHMKDIVGVDLSEEMLAIARQKLPDIQFVQADLEGKLPFDDGEFDKVVSSLTFQFLNDIKNPLQEIKRVLKTGGKAFITDFISDAPMGWSDVEYKREKLFKGSVSSISTFRTLKDYKKVAKEVGLELLEVVPLKITENAKEILTEKSWKKIKDSWASVIFVFEKS